MASQESDMSEDQSLQVAKEVSLMPDEEANVFLSALRASREEHKAWQEVTPHRGISSTASEASTAQAGYVCGWLLYRTRVGPRRYGTVTF